MYMRELTTEEFNKFTDKFPYSSIYQTSEYGFIMNNQNYESMFLGLIDGNEIVAASLILIEKINIFKYAYAPQGFLIDYNNELLVEEFTIKIKEFLGKMKIIAIKINPMIIRSYYNDNLNTTTIDNDFEQKFNFLTQLGYYHLGFNNLFESFKPRYNAIIDLNKPITSLFLELNKNLKSKITNADKNGVRIIKAREDELDYLYDQVKYKYPRDKKYFMDVLNFFSKREMIDYYYAKLDTNVYLINLQKKYQKQIDLCTKINNKLFNNVGKNNKKIINKKIYEENKLNELKNELIFATKLLKEFPNGIVIATMLITKYKEEIYIYMDGYNKEFKKLNAKHLMTWKLIEKYSKENFKTFNLGGMINPNINNDKYKGLNEFKLNFNATCIEYIGDLELVTNNALYTLYRNSKPLRYILKNKIQK